MEIHTHNGRPILRPSLFPEPPSTPERFIGLVNEAVQNVIQGRTELFRQMYGGGRDVWEECRFPNSSIIDAWYYRGLYDRNSIANRVVEVMPMETWQQPPSIVEDEDAEAYTDFEEAIDELGQSLNPQGKSWVKDDKGSPLWNYLKRADVLSGIGSFGVLMLGIDDGRNLQDPADGVIPIVNNKAMLDSPPSKAEIDELKQLMSKEGVVVNRKLPYEKDEVQFTYKLAGTHKSVEQVVENYYKPTYQLPKNYWYEPINEHNHAEVRNYYMGGGAPPAGSFITGTDTEYSWQSGLGMKIPEGASLSGTDQQYFGVQFGPSEQFQDKPSKQHRLLFLRSFDESLVQVVRYEWNIRNPRFGLPVMYRITLNDPRQPHSGVGLPLATVYVHWSRLIHLTDNMVVSEIFGLPRMKPVLPEILNIEKVKAGGAEGYWRSCFTGLAFKTQPQLGGDVAVDKGRLDEMIDQYWSGLRRSLVLMGMDVDPIAPQVEDPTPHVAVNMEGIAVKMGMPIRVFKGSERGELASSQDDETWNERKADRQQGYLTPRVIVPFVDRLIQLGILPEPEQYQVQWPDLDALGDKDKSGIALQMTQALGAYVSGNVETIMEPHSFLTNVCYFTEEQADEMVKAAAKNAEDQPMTMPNIDDPGHPAASTPKPPPGFAAGPGGKPMPLNPPQPGQGGTPKPGQPSTPKPGQPAPPKQPTTNAWSDAARKAAAEARANGKTVVASWHGKGNDFVHLYHHQDTGYTFGSSDGGGSLPQMANHDEAIAHMERPWGKGGAGPVTVMKEDVKSLKRVPIQNFNPDQERDERGRFGSGSGASAITKEPHTPPPPGNAYQPDVEKAGKSGVTIAARVGVPAMTVPPPPSIPRLPNLTPYERAVEGGFIEHYEHDPDKVAGDFTNLVKGMTKPGEPPTFGTDDAKALSDVWRHPDAAQQSENRSTLNNALHQTANAIAKRAFLQHLNTLKPGDEVLVTVGGCGAGKGYALKNVPEALAMKQGAKAVWDSAGDQNATENPWVQRECEKRGLKANYVYVHTDPYKQWDDPNKGVVKRAGDPADGRMVDAKVFADSYAIGAKNHQAFYEANKDNPNAKFAFIDNTSKPTLISGIPKEALSIDRHDLAQHALASVKKSDAPPRVKRGATSGERIWAGDHE